MLSRWLNSANPSSLTRQSTLLESSIDDAHTRDLLFPPASLLNSSQSQTYPLSASSSTSATVATGRGYDNNQGDIRLEGLDTVRIIVAQDETERTGGASLLYDSAPWKRQSGASCSTKLSQRPKTSEDGQNTRTAKVGRSTPLDDSRHQGIPRLTRLSDDARSMPSGAVLSRPRSPVIDFDAVFGGNGGRATSISSMPDIAEGGRDESSGQPDDFTKSCLDCMFGKHKLSYKGAGTKLHVLSQPSAQPSITKSASTEAFGTFGRTGRRQRSQLSNSYTPSEVELRSDSASANVRRYGGSETTHGVQVMITRTFTVTLTSARAPGPTCSTSSMSNGKSLPFPQVKQNSEVQQLEYKTVQSKAPTFAVAVIVQLPAARKGPSTQSMRKHSGLHVCSSFQTTDSLSSSLESEKRAAWTFLDPFSDADSPQFNIDDDPLSFITQHLDLFQRALTSMQLIVQAKLTGLLQVAEPSSPPYARSTRASGSRLTYSVATQAGQSSTIRLGAYELARDKDVGASVVRAIRRLFSGVTTPHVVTGQCRWGVWREELRWIEKWAAGGERGLFILKLLTAYLSVHTEWLNELAPEWYRRRRTEQQNSNGSEEMTLTRRTVIVSNDKMAARRLIFLLSAFLPASVHQTHSIPDGLFRTGEFLDTARGSSTLRSSLGDRPLHRSDVTEYGVGAHIGIAPRHIIGTPQQVSRQNLAEDPQLIEGCSDGTSGVCAKMSLQGPESDAAPECPPLVSKERSCRSSDAQSIRNLTTPATSLTRRSSSATTSTVTTALPIVHFANPIVQQSVEPASSGWPDNVASSTSSSLMYRLHRQNSVNSSNVSREAQSRSRWSIMSMWTGSQRSDNSTIRSESIPSRDGQTKPRNVNPGGLLPKHPNSRLDQAAAEMKDGDADGELYACDLEDDDMEHHSKAPPSLNRSREHPPDVRGASASKTERDPQQHTNSRLKLSVSSDGIIDIDIPLPTVGSPLQSPQYVERARTASIDSRSACLTPYHYSPDPPVRVAGWLERFHEDFELQAVNRYAELEGDVRGAMRGEPTPASAALSPSPEQGPVEKWVEVCTTLIADADSFSIKRLRLRRKIRLYPIPSGPVTAPGPSMIPRVKLQKSYQWPQCSAAHVVTMAEEHLEEKVFEEPVLDVDGRLSEAIERVLASSTQPSTVHSAAASRSTSKKSSDEHQDENVTIQPTPEVSRADCRKIVLGALEDIIKIVQEGRAGESMDGNQASIEEGGRGKGRSVARNSCLREGVRRWLEEVEKPLQAC